MEEEMIEQEVPAEEMEPGDAFMQLLADLQERYQISDEDINTVVDAFNVCMGADVEEPVEEPVEDEELPE